MSDAPQNLRTSLTALRAQLQSSALPGSEISPEMRSQLEELMMEIDQVLRNRPSGSTTSAPTPDRKSLIQRLTSAEKHFEETHPSLAGLVGSLLDALAGMGI